MAKILVELEHDQHRGGPGKFQLLADTGSLEISGVSLGGVFAATGQAAATGIVITRLGLKSVAIPNIILTGGWLYAVGDSPKVGTRSATASAPGSALIIIIEEGHHKFIHPFKGASATSEVSRPSGARQPFNTAQASMIIVTPSTINPHTQIDSATDQKINGEIYNEAAKWQMRWG